MCLQRYGLDTKRNFWRRNDDVYPKRQIYFHFNSKSVIKNALELVLGPFTSNPQQVKKNFLGVLENSRTPPWKFPGPDQWFFAPWKIPGPPLENSRTQPVTRSWIFQRSDAGRCPKRSVQMSQLRSASKYQSKSALRLVSYFFGCHLLRSCTGYCPEVLGRVQGTLLSANGWSPRRIVDFSPAFLSFRSMSRRGFAARQPRR